MATDEQTRSEFNDLLGDLAKKLKDAVNSLATLEVHTIVADFEVTVTTPNNAPVTIALSVPANAGKTANGAYTAINALTGDIRTLWSSNLDPVANATLLNVHNENVSLSREIFTSNLKVVGDLIKEFT